MGNEYLNFLPYRIKYFLNHLFNYLFILLILQSGCKDHNPTDDGGAIINLPIPPALYNSPVWYPSGKFIGFNHTPLKSIHYATSDSSYPDMYELDYKSTGFWLIDTNGTNMRRILPYTLQDPAWSPDGEWIAFVSGAQIFKMRFTGNSFDTNTVTQLTFDGRNFFPSWSPDGQWIAFDISFNELNSSTGIWCMKFDGNTKQLLFRATIPFWHPNGEIIIGVIGTSPTDIWTRFLRYNIQIHQVMDTLLAIIGNNNLYPRFSPDGTKIAFSSQSLNKQLNLWIMDSIGGNLHQLTTEGMSDNSGLPFSWHPRDNLIVFTQYRFDKWPLQNGTLWILNVSTGEKRQLTFNNTAKF